MYFPFHPGLRILRQITSDKTILLNWPIVRLPVERPVVAFVEVLGQYREFSIGIVINYYYKLLLIRPPGHRPPANKKINPFSQPDIGGPYTFPYSLL